MEKQEKTIPVELLDEGLRIIAQIAHEYAETHKEEFEKFKETKQ